MFRLNYKIGREKLAPDVVQLNKFRNYMIKKKEVDIAEKDIGDIAGDEEMEKEEEKRLVWFTCAAMAHFDVMFEALC